MEETEQQLKFTSTTIYRGMQEFGREVYSQHVSPLLYDTLILQLERQALMYKPRREMTY